MDCVVFGPGCGVGRLGIDWSVWGLQASLAGYSRCSCRFTLFPVARIARVYSSCGAGEVELRVSRGYCEFVVSPLIGISFALVLLVAGHTTQLETTMALIYRAWENGRKPQTDSVEHEIVQSMVEESDAVFACFLAKVDGFPTVSHIIKGTWRSRHYNDAKAAAQELLG